MRNAFVAGNWKMHGSRASVSELLDALISGVPRSQDLDIAIFPPFVYLPQVANRLQACVGIRLGAQTVSEYESGAFTGEVSAHMLQDVGCDYVLVGHSERRQYGGESNQKVAQKFSAALAQNLKPILCIGETLEEYEANQTQSILKNQLDAVLSLPDGIHLLKHADALIAYEPVWAIGTGRTAMPELAQSVHSTIRAYLASFDSSIAESVRLLYGGSVKKNNAGDLLKMPDIDGVLVGGASLDASEFIEICKQALGEKACNS